MQLLWMEWTTVPRQPSIEIAKRLAKIGFGLKNRALLPAARLVAGEGKRLFCEHPARLSRDLIQGALP
jgi:hypothetical protein